MIYRSCRFVNRGFLPVASSRLGFLKTLITQVISRLTSDSKLQYKYGDVFNGYAVTLKGKDLDLIRQSKDIEYVEEDGIMTIDDG